MNFLWVILLFMLYVGYSYLVDYLLREEKEKRKKTAEHLMPIVNEQEKKYNIKAAPFLNLRVMSIFFSIENEQEKTSMRSKFIEILEKAKLKPGKYFFWNLTRAFFFTGIIYLAVFFLKEEPNDLLTYATLAIVAFSLISLKRYMLAVLSVCIGWYFYPALPGTVMLLILMNRVWALIKQLNK